ncbi:hypothetical protein GGR57DRAFT_477573 [Xylariaceae sp. FL1272]|nr:hypothetical protein GGR57DRAFT_477573 [Xylariaceae sp. FL1272]
MPQPISQSMIDSSRKRGDDPMNVEDAPQLWIGINLGWSLEADDEVMNDILVDCLAAVEEYTKARGVYKPFVFLNDAHSSQDPLRRYGQGSFTRFKATSKAYDPEGVFQTLVSGGFKLS